MYAIREIAKVRYDPDRIKQATTEIFLLSIYLTLGGYIAVAVICMTVGQVQTNIPLFLILSTTLLFTAIGCEWFYQGIEDFRYVAIRGIVVRIVSVIFLFLLVKSEDDILWYGAYTVFGVLGGNIFNFVRIRKYLGKNAAELGKLHPFRHFKPALCVFAVSAVAGIYLQLNNVLLGFIKGAEAVGYFTAATKILFVIMSITGSLSAVMMPRTSNLIAENKMNEFKALIQKSYDFILALTMPLTVGLIFASKSVILLLSGSGFASSILTSQIVASNILMVGVSGVMGLQVLYPMGKTNIVILCTVIGAVTNVVMNILLIPRYGYDGAAVAYILAEAAVTVSMFFIGRKYYTIHFFKREHLNYVFGSIVMGVCLYFISLTGLGDVGTLLAMVLGGGMIYVAVLYAANDSMCMLLFRFVRVGMMERIRNKF